MKKTTEVTFLCSRGLVILQTVHYLYSSHILKEATIFNYIEKLFELTSLSFLSFKIFINQKIACTNIFLVFYYPRSNNLKNRYFFNTDKTFNKCLFEIKNFCLTTNHFSTMFQSSF